MFNPTDAQYEAAGYLTVIYTPEPEAPEGYYAVAHWEEQDGEIVEVWVFEPNPEPPADNNTPAWDIWNGRHITRGELCSVDGLLFSALQDHDAAWNKRPLTGALWTEYWEEVSQ